MGQYWRPVNLDKKECLDPHALGCGLKLCEQLANSPGVGSALIILTAAMPEPRGGGDLDLDRNWHGPERKFPEHNATPGPMPDDYPAVAARTIGRWAGDRIALVGDYAEDGDLAPEHSASTIYGRCLSARYPEDAAGIDEPFVDITPDVIRVIEHELGGKFSGDGWAHWEEGRS